MRSKCIQKSASQKKFEKASNENVVLKRENEGTGAEGKGREKVETWESG